MSSSQLSRVLGREATVASYHHQGIAIIGTGLKAVAWSEDGSIEAVESTDPDSFLVGVLWHPEQTATSMLFHRIDRDCT